MPLLKKFAEIFENANCEEAKVTVKLVGDRPLGNSIGVLLEDFPKQ